MDALGARVRQELRSHVTTPYLSRDGGGESGATTYFYQAGADIPPMEPVSRKCTVVPVPTTNGSEYCLVCVVRGRSCP